MANHEVELLLRDFEKASQERQSRSEVLSNISSVSSLKVPQSAPPNETATSLMQFMDLLPIPIILVDRSHKIRFINIAMATINGDYSTVLGEDISRLFPQQSDCLGVKALLESMPRCGHAQIKEGQIKILSKRVNCRICLSSTCVAGEEFTMFVVEDCALEQKVTVLTEQCQTLVAAAPAGVAHFQLKVPVSMKAPLPRLTLSVMSAQLKTANDQFACMHGFTGVGELRGALASEFVLPFGPLESVFRYWIEEGLPLHRTNLNCDSADAEIPGMEVALAANIIENTVISFWIVERSLEKRFQMQAILRSVGGRFRTVFESVDDLILMKDLNSRYLEVNPAAARFLGVDSDAVRGKGPEDVWGGETGRRIRKSDASALEGITTDRIYTDLKGGHTVHLTSSPMRDLRGSIIGLFEIGHLVQAPWPASKSSDTELSRSQDHRFPVCHSAAMRKTLETVWVAARTEGTILLTGETGSGKDFLASLIHETSSRAARPFITINCAAVPVELAESELFGHEPGAFTGAGKQKKGMLELANGGTLLMNEIGDLPLALQAKLLTFLDTNCFCRVGGTKQISVDARILAATNRPLSEDIANGRFRADLFYRLNVLSIGIPPLRERREDLPELMKDILADLTARNGHRSVPQVSPSVMSALLDYGWPGNVRELKSVMQRLLILSEAGEVTPKSLGLDDASRQWVIATHFPQDQSLNEVLDEVKYALIEEALKRTGGKRQEAANLLGISRNSLKHHMRVRPEHKRSATKPAVSSERTYVAAKETS